MTSATFREVDGIEVMPLIEAELDRLHTERLRLRPTTPETMRDAVFGSGPGRAATCGAAS